MKKFLFLLLSSLFILSGAACVRIKVGGMESGIFMSEDKGDHWGKIVSLLSIEGAKKVSGDVTAMVFDPQDTNVIYLGTSNAAYFTINGGKSWQEIERLPRERVEAIAVEPRSGENIYFAFGTRIFKGERCLRTWQNVYIDPVSAAKITYLTVDWALPNLLYVGTSDGRVLRSLNGGASWSVVKDFESKILEILPNPFESRIIYVLTKDKGIFRSEDGGASWFSLDESLKNYPGARRAERGVFDFTKRDSLLILSDYGILRTDDGGKTWTPYKLLTPPGKVKIYSFNLNRGNPQEIYYITETTFHRSLDGGVNWVTKSLPLREPAKFLLINPTSANILYLGFSSAEE